MLNENEVRKFSEDRMVLEGLKNRKRILVNEATDKLNKENAELFELIDNATEQLELIKEDLKIKALDEFKLKGEKKLLGGIGIRVMELLEYEQDNALEWAKKHELCLTLDNSAFKKIAKTQDIDFVEKIEKITVTFPKEIKLGELK